VITAGTKLGPYEILEQIGAGGMGEVYRARDPKLGRDVAIKVLPEAFARDTERMARFQREAKVLASLDHPNIATIHGLEESGGTRALVMQLVEGPTLADRIKAGPIPVDEAIRIARQIADALEYAHERGIIHRDLKPANVKVTNDDAVKVLDFGLAKALEGDPSSFDISTSPTISRMATMQGVLLGTAAYMAPEQAKAKTVDRRADIWAFGCVLYEMLTGKQAFTGETVTDTLASIIKEEPDWKLLPAQTPMRVRVLLQRCLQKDPKQRLRDIGDARISLDEVLTDSVPSPGGAVPILRRAIPWALFGVTAFALAIVAWAPWRAATSSSPAEPVRFQILLPEAVTFGAANTFALSPDGRQLAFAAPGSDGVQRLWIRRLDSVEARPLTGTESPSIDTFFWSPDSRFIAFRSSTVVGAGGAGKLKKIAVSGGPAESLCDVNGNMAGGAWNRDGVIIVGTNGGLTRVSAAGGSTSPLTITVTPGEAHLFPQFLPDGRHFLYSRAFGPDEREKNGIYLGSLDAKPQEQATKRLVAGTSQSLYVGPSDSASGYLLFVRDGTLLAQPFDAGRAEPSGEAVLLAEGLGSYSGIVYGNFSASANGVLAYPGGNNAAPRNQLTWFDRQGKVQRTANAPSLIDAVNLSPDGNRAFVFDASGRNPGLWLLDFSRDTKSRFTFGSSPAGEPTYDAVWSADGNRVIFVSSRDGGFTSLFEKPASGTTDEVLLLKSGDIKHPRSWSRDGRFLLYDDFDAKTGKSGIWVLPMGGDKKATPVLRAEFDQGGAQISPDGRWMAYAADESGHSEVYVRAFSPDSGSVSTAGGKWLISNGGGTDARWRADGKELYYLAPDGKVMAVELTTSPTFQAGVPKELFQGPPLLFPFGAPRPSQWGATADGKRFLFVTPVASAAQTSLTVVLNWQAALKK
jgi:Tol biopolymer transport system component